MLACADMLQRRLARLHAERAALCQRMAHICSAPAAAPVSSAQDTCEAREPSASSARGGGSLSSHDAWSRALQPHGAGSSCSEGGDAPPSPPPLDAFAEQSEIVAAMEANTRRMAWVMYTHLHLIFLIMTDVQRARLMARVHPVPVSGPKGFGAMRYVMKMTPDAFPPAEPAKLQAQQAAWLAAREREVRQRVAEGVRAAKVQEEALEQLSALVAAARGARQQGLQRQKE